MKQLVLSDLHLGDPRIDKDGRILRLLRELDYDELILNGDIADLWVKPEPLDILKSHSLLIEALRGLCKVKKVVWVIGNHDRWWRYTTIAPLRILLPDAAIVPRYRIDVGSKRILCVHGHEMETTPEWILRVSCAIKIFVWNWTHLDLQRFFGSIGGFYKCKMARLQLLYVKAAGEGYDAVILGHTHIPLEGTCGEIEYVNCGDWVEHCSYVTIDNGRISLWSE